MKDFFDIWLLARQFDFSGQLLSDAVEKTFANRGTTIPVNPVAFSESFAGDKEKHAQWRAFLKKSQIDLAPTELAEVVVTLAAFLTPIIEAVRGRHDFRAFWNAGGPWIEPTS